MLDQRSLSEIVLGGLIEGYAKPLQVNRDSLTKEGHPVYDLIANMNGSVDTATLKAESFTVVSAAQQAVRDIKPEEMEGFIRQLEQAAGRARVGKEAEKQGKRAQANQEFDLSAIKEYSEEDNRKATCISLKELLETAPEEPPMIIDGLLPEGGLVGIGGDPGTAKTWAAFDMALAVAEGKPGFWGRPIVKQVPVLICANGMYRGGVEQRIRALQAGRNTDPDTPLYVEFSEFYLDTSEGLNVIERFLSENGVRLVIIDMFLDYLSTVDTYRGDEVATMISRFRSRLEKYGATAILNHHGTKSKHSEKSMRAFGGAIQILGGLEMGYEATYRDGSYYFEQIKNRVGTLQGTAVMSLENPKLGSTRLNWGKPKNEPAIEFIERLVAANGELTRPKAIKLLKEEGLPAHNEAWNDLVFEVDESAAVWLDRTSKTHVIKPL